MNSVSNFTSEYSGLSKVLKNKAKITEGFDPTQIPHQQHPIPEEYDAIWDTGATNSVISKKVVQECGLKPITMVRVNTAGGTFNQNVYVVNIFLPNKVNFVNVHVTEGNISNADILIGMDIIGNGDFAVSNYNGKTVFTYRFPSVERIDFVKAEKNASIKPIVSIKVGRNEPCPCGSGKKYKYCCGR